MDTARFALLLRTTRHLRPAQVFHRLRLVGRRRLWERMPARIEARYAGRAAALPGLDFAHPGLARVAALRAGRTPLETALAVARDARAGRFRFLEVERELGREVDWFRADLDRGTRLWKTLLHEFSYAPALARAARETGDRAHRERLFELMRGWRAAAPVARPGFALDAWNARAVARRLVHWALAGHWLGLAPAEPDAVWLSREIGLHALFLRDNLEWDLRGNHLWSDLTALVFADALLGAAPDALTLLRRQIDEQLLPDGCHVERVPLYHALALQDLLEARAVLGERAPPWLGDAVERMAGFLAELLPGDGQLPLLGDSWHGEVDPQRVLAEAGAKPVRVDPQLVAEASGLVVLRAGSAHAVVRAGEHGPGWQMGHAHADGLSFELSWGRARIVCDSGTPTYDEGPERRWARSTAAHNTVQIDGAEQLEAWGSFRVGRRGRARVAARGREEGWDWVCAVHDGWRRLPGAPIHHRLVALCEGALVVLDAVLGGGRHRLRSALHLHPDRPRPLMQALPFAGRALEGETPLHERWNRSRPAPELAVEAESELPWTGGWLVLLGAHDAPPRLDLTLADGLVEARCDHPEARFSVRWRPALPLGRGGVTLSRCSTSEPSAT